jgi:hypothetical protein
MSPRTVKILNFFDPLGYVIALMVVAVIIPFILLGLIMSTIGWLGAQLLDCFGFRL